MIFFLFFFLSVLQPARCTLCDRALSLPGEIVRDLLNMTIVIHVASLQILMIAATNVGCLQAEETRGDKAHPDILPLQVRACTCKHGTVTVQQRTGFILNGVFFPLHIMLFEKALHSFCSQFCQRKRLSCLAESIFPLTSPPRETTNLFLSGGKSGHLPNFRRANVSVGSDLKSCPRTIFS